MDDFNFHSSFLDLFNFTHDPFKTSSDFLVPLPSIPEDTEWDSSFRSDTPGISDQLSDMSLLPPLMMEQPVALAAPTAKRPRVLSISTPPKKIKESTDTVQDLLDQWLVPTSDGNNLAIQELVLPFEQGPEDPLDFLKDPFSFDDIPFQLDSPSVAGLSSPPPTRSKTAPPTMNSSHLPKPSFYPVDASMRRYSVEVGDGESKRFKCPQPWCSKLYKNANGLKYHLEHGNCEFNHDETEVVASPVNVPEEIKVVQRPFWCRVNGCGKKYKNLNGLKYHARIEHPEYDFVHEVKGHVDPNF